MTTPDTVRRLLDKQASHRSLDQSLTGLGAQLASQTKPLVLFGAGYMGRQALRALRAIGARVSAFIDDRSDLAGTSLDDVPVLSATHAGRQFPEAIACVTILQENASFFAVAAPTRRAVWNPPDTLHLTYL
jgi:FlaA1/EpsC-like NDP-sugar epimerase